MTHPGRRRALRALGGLGLAAFTGARAHAQRAEVIAAVDMHSHDGGVHFRRNPDYFIADRMRLGGLAAVCLCHTADGPVLERSENKILVREQPAPGQLYRHTVERLDFFDALVRGQNLRRMLKPGDLQAAWKDDAPALVQAIEGSHFLEGRLERIAEVHKRGVRQLQLLHFLKSDLGDNQTGPATHGGLTALGKEAIAECNRLGMVVDLAHASMQAVEQAAVASKAPLLLSHAPRLRQRAREQSRTVSLEHAKVVAHTGGVVGIWTVVGGFKSLSDWADGVARAVDALGADHVGIGSDTGGASKNLLADYRDFPKVLEALRGRGLSAGDIGKIAGGNYVRVFDRSTSPSV